MKSDVTLDTKGMLCPVPIVKTNVKVKELKQGQVIEVISTDLGIKEDMPRWCKSTGNEFLGIEEEGGIYKAYVRKK
ncbi:MAG TPA: sulfurtransferase TusA family protein [bacterium]